MYLGGECPLIAHLERCGRPNCRHITFKVEWVNPVEEQACTNSRTVPIGQLTGSSWQPPHHEVTLLLGGSVGQEIPTPPHNVERFECLEKAEKRYINVMNYYYYYYFRVYNFLMLWRKRVTRGCLPTDCPPREVW